ncbi:MAG: aminotransferase class IV [Halobacteriovoraceae bacterium]|nr:aminotransferase class IV [Halobacteriovoraceae bacterium]
MERYDARRFLYGDGFFTTIFVDNGKALFLTEHLERLERSAQIAYPKNIQIDDIEKEIKLKIKNFSAGTLRVDVCWGQKQKDLLVNDNGDFSIFYTLSEISKENHPLAVDKFVKVGFSSSILGKPFFSEKIKTVNYFEIFAERKNSRFDDLILTDLNGVICEASTSNVFFLIDDQWVTPKMNPNILPGITRKKILHFYPGIIERDISKDEITKIEEGFLTNSRNLIVPISEFENKALTTIEVESFKRDFLTQVYEELND